MKKIMISISIILVLGIVALGVKSNSVSVNKLKIKKVTTENLIECINKDDVKLLKNMFSSYELDEDDDIEQDIEIFLNCVGGEIKSIGECENLSEQEMYNHGKLARYYFGVYVKDVNTTNGVKYSMSYNMAYADDDYPESIGLESIMLFAENGDKIIEVGGL